MTTDNLFRRRSLDEICTIPDDIISVYVIEKHVWGEQGSEEARHNRQAELRTVDEFLIDPVRPFLNDMFQHLAAPYDPSRRDVHIGQGYWIQAEFGSGKSHVLSLVGALALGDENAWEIIRKKETEAGRGKRESLYTHYENGLKKKSQDKGIFVVVKTLVGHGSGTVGLNDTGRTLSEYLLEAIQAQYRAENGRPLPLFPAELLAQVFLREDLEIYSQKLEAFLKNPKFFDEEQQSTLPEFLDKLQNDREPGVLKDCGQKLWQFYTEGLETPRPPQIPRDTEEVLKYAVEQLLEEGYQGLLLILDEVSLFMQNRSESLRIDDESTLVVLSNRLVQNYNLPVWTVCAAQQAIEARSGVKNIIANERLKLIPLLSDERSYYDIALARVRTITDKNAPAAYFEDYRKAFTWPESVGKETFEKFFPFYPPSIDVIRSVSYGLTTVRSALYFMWEAVKRARKTKSRELVTLWTMFEDVVNYEEDPSGTSTGIAAIKTKWESEWRAYEAAKKRLGMVPKGEIKRWLARCEKILKTLFLYHVAGMSTDGLTPEEIMNCVMEWRDHDDDPPQQSDKTDNQSHYEILLKKVDLELAQVAETDRGFIFSPIRTVFDWNDVFKKARTEAEQSPLKQQQAWEFLIALDGWKVEGPHATRDLVDGHRSIFRKIATERRQQVSVTWRKREILGSVELRNLLDMAKNRTAALPPLDTAASDEDFLVYVSDRPCVNELDRLTQVQKDSRVLFWSPEEPTASERELLLDFAAYTSIVKDFKDQDSQDARTIMDSVHSHLRNQIGKIIKIVPDRYGRGRLCASDHANLPITMFDDLGKVLENAVATVLDATYESADLDMHDSPVFTDDEAVKVINGIVRIGEIPKTAKVDKNVSAVQNYAAHLGIVKRSDEKKLNTSGSRYTKALFEWVQQKVRDTGSTVPIDAIYKNFMGVGGPGGKNYGLSRRLIDLFLLCLVREAKIRITADPRSVDGGSIDYSAIKDIDFKKAVLQSMRDISLMEAPKGWEVLRPFAAVILDNPRIEEASQDAEIQEAIHGVVEKLKEWRKPVSELITELDHLFAALNQANPIADRLAAWQGFVDVEIDQSHQAEQILDAMDRQFGYSAYADMQYRQPDRDDLASRKKEIENASEFAKSKRDLRAAAEYAKLDVREEPLKEELKPHLKRLRKSMGQMAALIADPAKLANDLIEPLNRIRETYETRYMQVFTQVVSNAESVREFVEKLPDSLVAQTLAALNQVSALEKTDLKGLGDTSRDLLDALFPAHLNATVVRNDLVDTPYPRDAGNVIAESENLQKKAKQVWEEADCIYSRQVLRRAKLLSSKNMRDLLEQGKAEAFIKAILDASDEKALADLLVAELLGDPSKAKLIDKYLKKIKIVRMRMSDFRPDVATFGREDLDKVVKSFRDFIETQLGEAKDGETVVISIE